MNAWMVFFFFEVCRGATTEIVRGHAAFAGCHRFLPIAGGFQVL